MKKGDRVNINFGPKGTDHKSWRKAGMDEGTIGTITKVDDFGKICVDWANGCYTVSPANRLKPYKEEDIPLPNVRFRRLT